MKRKLNLLFQYLFEILENILKKIRNNPFLNNKKTQALTYYLITILILYILKKYIIQAAISKILKLNPDINRTKEEEINQGQEKINKKKHIIVYIIDYSLIIVLIKLAFFKIAVFLKNDDVLYNISFLDFFDANVPLLNSSKFWLTICVTSSVFFSIASNTIAQKDNAIKNKTNNKIKKGDIIQSFIINILKDFFLILSISIMNYGKVSQKNFYKAALLAIIGYAFISTKLLCSKIDLFYPIANQSNIHLIQNNTNLIKKNKLQNTEDTKKSKFSSLIQSLLYLALIIFCSNNKNRSSIKSTKFVIYFCTLLCLSFFAGIIVFASKKFFLDLISEYSILNYKFGFYIDEKYINIFDNQNQLFFSCFFDCLSLILVSIFLYHCSIKIFVYLSDKFSPNQIKLDIKNSIKKQNLNLDLLNYIGNLALKSCMILIFAIILSIFTHANMQINNSIFEYDHESFKSLLINGIILFCFFILFLSINHYIDLSFYNIEHQTKFNCNLIDETNSAILTLYLIDLEETLNKERQI